MRIHFKRGLCPPTAIAFSDTPALGRQARRTFTGEAMTVGGALIHAREPITCLRDLNPNLGDIPVLVVTDGRFEEAMAFSSPPQNLTDVIVAANHPDSPQSYRLPRHISPTGLRKFVLTVQHAASTSSAEAQRNLLAFLNGQLDQVRVAYRDDGSDARPAFPGVRLDGVPMAPMFNRDHTGDMAQLRNTRPTGRGRTSRPRGKPDGYHSRAGKGAEREL